KLYRSVCRTLPGWKKLREEIIDDIDDIFAIEYNPSFIHPNYEDYLKPAAKLYQEYKLELFEIMQVYDFKTEIELFCCSGEMQESVQTSTRRLFQHIEKKFTKHYDTHSGHCDCQECEQLKAKASACYLVCYQNAMEMKNKCDIIISFPWIFSKWLMKIQRSMNKHDLSLLSKNIVGIAVKEFFNSSSIKYRVLSPLSQNKQAYRARVYMMNINTKTCCLITVPPRIIVFIETIYNWLRQQNIFDLSWDDKDHRPFIRKSYWYEIITRFLATYSTQCQSMDPSEWKMIFNKTTERILDVDLSEDDYESMEQMYYELLNVCFNQACEVELVSSDTDVKSAQMHVAYLSEYLLIAFQNIAIQSKLSDIKSK
ncbi:unnamed protein product, partial [Didymodactylos carnosus]